MHHYLEQFSKVKKSLPGNNAWLPEMRMRAIERFAKHGFPDRKDEQWKYTSLYSLNKENFQFANNQQAGNLNITPFSKWYIFLDGTKRSNLPEGVSLQTFAHAMQDPEIQKYLNKSAVTHHNILLDLNLALMSQGYFIKVAKNTQLADPIHLICASSLEGVTTNTRNILVVEDNADLAFVEHYVGENKYFNNIATEIFLGKNSRCTIDNIQEESINAYHIADVLVEQQANSHFSWKSFSFGSALARTYIEVGLNKGAECDLQGISILRGKQHVDHNTLIKHLGSNSSSYEEFRGIYSGRSHGVFKGDIRVHKGAKKILSKQFNKNILLSDAAKVSTQPRLEIYDNDVQCSHGATVGQLDCESLFYLQTRGIREEDARKILMLAFIQSVISGVANQKVIEHINFQLNSILLDL